MSNEPVAPERFHAFDAEIATAGIQARKFSDKNALQKRLGIETIPDRTIFADYLTYAVIKQELLVVDQVVDRLKSSSLSKRRVLGILSRVSQRHAERRRDVLLDAQVYLIAERNDHISQLYETDNQRQSAETVMYALDDLFDRADQVGSTVRISSGAKIKEEVLAPWQEEWRGKLQEVG